jgi:hypothetical protein
LKACESHHEKVIDIHEEKSDFGQCHYFQIVYYGTFDDFEGTLAKENFTLLAKG